MYKKTFKDEPINDLGEIYSIMAKFSDWITLILVITGLIFLATLFLHNYTAAAIGLLLIGGAITLKVMLDSKRQSKALWYMWIAICVIIAVLLGIQYIIPKISFG